jgi:hypothetical protein
VSIYFESSSPLFHARGFIVQLNSHILIFNTRFFSLPRGESPIMATIENGTMAHAIEVKTKAQKLAHLNQKLSTIEAKLLSLSVKAAIAEKTACLDKLKEDRKK